DPDQAMLAVERARQAGFSRINLDLMFGLPGQTLASAAEDLSIALQLDPGHISYYQLTLEPNTHFHQFPPALPDDELIWEIHSQGQTRLAEAGYLQYEISAYARPGERCRHNLNYWCFGDYIGIGAGAHGKLTLADGKILRNWKQRHPQAYLVAACGAGAVQGERWLERDDRLLEFMMNALRLNEGFSLSQFETRSGLSRRQLDEALATAQARELLLRSGEQIRPSVRGHAFLNDLLAIFTPQ
ncbi:coproporphyrinogen-III oxidase family protein, partial [endosymbiont of Ridgeia piscesae]